MLKILIPFAIISANLGILNHRLGVAPSALFMIVMSVSDVMTLNFFYMVRDEGSWLDIGTTISHFCIASGMSVFVAGLEFLSQAFIAGIEFREGDAEDVDGLERNGRSKESVTKPLPSTTASNGASNGKGVGGADSTQNMAN